MSDNLLLAESLSQENPLWGAPRLHGELLKLGFSVAQRTVAKYMAAHLRSPSPQTWKTFPRNHLAQTVSVDFFSVPTITFRVLHVFVVLWYERRQVLHFNITPVAFRLLDSPTIARGLCLWQPAQIPP